MNKVEELNVRTIKNFRIQKSMLNKGIVISVPSQGFFYNHDEIFNLAEETDNDEDRVHTVDRATGYSMTKGYPTWAADGIFVGGYEEKNQ